MFLVRIIIILGGLNLKVKKILSHVQTLIKILELSLLKHQRNKLQTKQRSFEEEHKLIINLLQASH